MGSSLLRRIQKAARSLPLLLRGYSPYLNPDKLRLIDYVFRTLAPEAQRFADLGGVWRVHGGYALYTARTYPVTEGILVDTDYPESVKRGLGRQPRLRVIQGDFGTSVVAAQVGKIDVVYFFDVLLHQANPDWNEVLALYADLARCIVIYNQQYIDADTTIHLTDLPLEKYMEIASDARPEVYRYIYQHKRELHPEYGKPWGDIHNISQWGITDRDLRSVMEKLGYREVFFRNYGRFAGLPAFEEHGFVFRKS
jgi:hypothetical protein